MATVAFIHAHPDDEAIVTAGTMASLSADGHRVVLITATGGELGEYPPGFLEPGETLGQRRAAELRASAAILGVARLEQLGHLDSGMAGTPGNDDPACFSQADTDEVAARVAAILAEERADVVVVYDEHGNYGHPDHIKAHQVGMRAADLAGTERVYLMTQNRDFLRSLLGLAADLGVHLDEDRVATLEVLGEPEHRITTRVDVTAHIGVKAAAMRAHASQIGETDFYLALPGDAFAMVWGTEWYIRVRGAPGPASEDDGRERSLLA